jgi:hypothetical protein
MTNILSKEERTQIVNSHKKNLAMNKYNLELSVLTENAKVTPDSDTLSSLNAQTAVIDNQIAVLDEELASISAE